jgi:hypothetical protein
MYKERMNSYYPQVIQSINEFQGIINAEYPEFEDLSSGVTRVTKDAYLSTMSKERVEQWERIFNIAPLPNSSIDDRRETIIARVRGQGKLNTALINSIVQVFTGGTANSWIEDGVLYVEITPPPGNKQYKFANVEQELRNKVPAHLGFSVSRNYLSWDDINDRFESWEAMNETLSTWNDVFLFTPFTSYKR